MALTVRQKIVMDKMRGAVTRRVTTGYNIPNTTLHTRTDVTDTIAFQRRWLSRWRSEGIRLQYQDLVVTALVAAIKEHPRANAHFTDEALLIYNEINVGIAVAVGEGLMVPVVQNAHTKSLPEIAKSIREIVQGAKLGKMPSLFMTDSTFTVSSLTSYDVDNFTPILNAPETNSLGVGRVTEEPRLIDGELQNRFIGHLSLTFDHRSWDGAPAARFLHSIVSRLAQPDWMLGES